MSKILLVGDLHFKTQYGHADLFADRRVEERLAIEDAIVRASEGCDATVLMGDILNARENHPNVLAHLARFIGDLSGYVYCMAGNHSKFQDGTSALDVYEILVGLHEDPMWDSFAIKEPKGCRYNKGVWMIPFMHRQELGAADDVEAAKLLAEGVPEGTELVLAHHCIGGTKSHYGVPVEEFHEPILPAEEILKKAKFIIGSHIHRPSESHGGRVLVVGSVMNEAWGEDDEKRLLIYDTEKKSFESIPLPGRRFPKLVDPTDEELEKTSALYGAAKVIVTKMGRELPKSFKPEVMVVDTVNSMPEDVPREVDDLSVPSLLKSYSEVKQVEYSVLERGMEIANKVN